MLVAVGSQNPIKVKAVQTVFSEYFSGIKVISVNVKPSVGLQPMGLRITVKGAVERALTALRKTQANFGVGLEAGLIENLAAASGFLNQQVCVIVDKEERATVGISTAFEPPYAVVESLVSNKVREMEEVMESITGIKAIGEKQGAVGFLTRGKITRYDLSLQATLAALIPFINPSLYPRDRLPKATSLLKRLEELDV